MSEATVLLGVLSEARQQFGPVTPANKAQVTAYVQQRMREIKGHGPTYEPKGFDAKSRAAHEGEE